LFKWHKTNTEEYELITKKQVTCILTDHFVDKMILTLESWLQIILA